jgi:O-antigen ligase
VFAGLGMVAGVVRMREWRFRRKLLPGAILVFFTMLTISVAAAALYSGPELAAQSLARVALAGISLYVFFYVSAGPGRGVPVSRNLLYGIAVASAAFACLDFYYQFPAPAGFGAQYIWLESGVYRRAQGLFYEAGTLGNFCAFFLVMTAVGLVRRAANRWMLLAGGAIFATALMFSYSRSSIVNVVLAIGTLAILERKRPGIRRILLAGGGVLGVTLLALFRFVPEYTQMFWTRLWVSAGATFTSNEAVLSGRLETWRVLGQFLAEHPWHAIAGVGYKTLPYSDFIGQKVVADNMYLSLLVETGIVGLAALLILNLAILKAGYAAARSPDPEKSFYGTWIFCFWLAESVQMLSADLLTFWRVLPLYFWVLAMAVRSR